MSPQTKKYALYAGLAGLAYWLWKGQKPATVAPVQTVSPATGAATPPGISAGGGAVKLTSAMPAAVTASTNVQPSSSSSTLSGTVFTGNSLASRRGMGSLG